VLYQQFLKIADVKKEVSEDDLNAMANEYKPKMETING
jgi:hypothetical protein